MYEVLLHREAAKALRRLPAAYRQRVGEALDAMERDPFSAASDVCKLRGEFEGLWRLRLGDVRVIFAVDTEARRVFVEGVSFREGAYRR
ncbi:MAG: type II toxin-antitoxin system RelE/ParE family toxin [Bacillota bacterium]